MLTFSVTSCATAKIEGGADSHPSEMTSAGTRPVYVTNSRKISLLLPEYAESAADALQLLTGSFGKNSFSLLVYSQIDSNGINLSLFNDFGTDMGSLFYDGSQVSFESAFFPDSLPAEYILLDIQNVYYKADALRANYADAKLNFEVAPAEDGTEIRRIFSGKKLVEEIRIGQGSARIENFLRGYSFSLTLAE